MKKKLLIYSASFAALVALGVSFDREKLDEMLYKLKRTGKPGGYFYNPLLAMCYVQTVEVHRAEYICPSCGERTYYLYTEEDFKSLKNARKGAEQLRKLGLKIEVSEQAFCYKCNPDKSAFYDLPFYDLPETGIDFGMNDKETPKESDLTVDEESSKELNLTDERNISPVEFTFNDKKQAIPDKKNEVIERPKVLYPSRTTPSWVITINGEKRIVSVQEYDVEILTAHLKKKKNYSEGRVKKPLQIKQPRLKELLGNLGE